MKTFIKLVRLPTAEDKLGPQINACVNALARAVKDKVGDRAERTEVIKELTSGAELVTRQDPARILSFYQPQLVEKGIILIEKESEPKPEKPAKETAAKPAAAAGANKDSAPAAAPKPAAAAPAAAKPAGATA